MHAPCIAAQGDVAQRARGRVAHHNRQPQQQHTAAFTRLLTKEEKLPLCCRTKKRRNGKLGVTFCDMRHRTDSRHTSGSQGVTSQLQHQIDIIFSCNSSAVIGPEASFFLLKFTVFMGAAASAGCIQRQAPRETSLSCISLAGWPLRPKRTPHCHVGVAAHYVHCTARRRRACASTRLRHGLQQVEPHSRQSCPRRTPIC